MLTFVQQYGRSVHSQNPEDGIVEECLRRIPEFDGYKFNGEAHSAGHVVEIGANNGLWLSNSRLLIEQGWSGTLVEASWELWNECQKNYADNPRVKCICSQVDRYNVNAFVKSNCVVLSTDTDGADYQIFEGLRARPAVIIVEIDSSYPPDVVAFNSDGGASYRAMVELAYRKQYRVLCHTGNIVLIRAEDFHLFPELTDELEQADLYFNRGWLPAQLLAE